MANGEGLTLVIELDGDTVTRVENHEGGAVGYFASALGLLAFVGQMQAEGWQPVLRVPGADGQPDVRAVEGLN